MEIFQTLSKKWENRFFGQNLFGSRTKASIFFFTGNLAKQTSQTYLTRVQANRKIALKKYKKPCQPLQNFESLDPGLNG